MKYWTAIACVVLLGSVIRAQEPRPELTKLAWISGCWQSDGAVQTQEQWTKLAGQSMLGVNRGIKEGRTVSFEFLQIREQGGDVFYIAQPNGGAPVRFKLVKVNESAAVFENPQHDFPQRIFYERQIDGSLLAGIEGTQAGKPKRIEFPMKRVKCD